MSIDARRSLEGLTSDDPGVVADSVTLAASVFQRGDHGAEVRLLREKLIDLIRRPGQPLLLGSIVWALGKLDDPTLRPIFVDIIAQHVEGDADVLYQAMIALDNLGVPVFGGRTSMSALDEDLNRELAKAFLSGEGPSDATA